MLARDTTPAELIEAFGLDPETATQELVAQAWANLPDETKDEIMRLVRLNEPLHGMKLRPDCPD